MKELDSKLEPWSDGEFRRIHIEDEYTYSGWWQEEEDPGYNYTRDKSEQLYSACGYVCQYFDSNIEGFVGSALYALSEDKYGFSKYDRYVEMVEFGWDDSCLISSSYLIDYFIEYARYVGAKFIRIPNKEDFPKFYSKIIPWVDDTYENDCYIISIDDPIVYDEYIHIKHYDEDFVTVEDLYFLHYIGYEIGRDACFFKLFDCEISIDRHTGIITFPSYIYSECESPTIFSTRYYPLLCMIKYYCNSIKIHSLVYDVKIDGFDYDFAYMGNDRLVVFEDITRSDTMFDTVYRISKTTNFEKYTTFTARILTETLFASYSYCDRKISSDLYNCGLCLELDDCIVYPPHENKLADKELNQRLEKIKSFGLILEDENSALSEAYIFFEPGIASVVYRGRSYELRIEGDEIIKILQGAHFSTWKQEFCGEGKVSFGITLELEDEAISFRGNGSTPRIWEYFIKDLIKGLKLDEI
ncbi:MAG: hypothetical protein IJ309_01145 [Clostridia bacterium]|nr:hypothetical protein [Clostridia bacterium]